MSVKNGGDEDRPSILNEESESRIDSPTVDDGPFFVAAKKRKTITQSQFIVVFFFMIKEQIELFS